MREALAQALTDAAAEIGWKAAHIAAAVNKSEQSARNWMRGISDLTGADLLVLMSRMPGLKQRVLALINTAERRAA